jgi:hypothetical protein
MLRLLVIILLMILFFLQIQTINTKSSKQRFQSQGELIKMICGKNGIYCKRSLTFSDVH